MSKPESITIDGEVVYSAEDIYNYDTSYFLGCARIRSMIEKKKMRDEDYLFAYQKKGVWTKSTSGYPRAKLFLREEYVVRHVPKMMNEVRQDSYKYEEAPPVLVLYEEEKFKDTNGRTINIEVRGEREHNKCYFKLKDVSVGFELPNLNTTILHKERNYDVDLHYKTFEITLLKEQRRTSKKCLYLTYCGMLKVLFCSRTGNAEAFQQWATEKLFTIQMGEESQKDKLAAELIGVHHQTISDVFRANTAKTPCVYLYMIGRASDILEGDYHPDDLLCKYGCTEDLPRRCDELHKKFNKEFGANIGLLQFSIIEARYKFDAESGVAQYFRPYSVDYKNMKELIIINRREMPQIKQYYSMVQHSYIGRFEELNAKVAQLEKEIIGWQNKLVLKDKDTELLMALHTIELGKLKTELQDEKHKNEIQEEKHRRELLELKMNYMERVAATRGMEI